MLVDSGRVVPGVVVHPDGRLRSQWWPLPIASDRQWLAALLPDDSPQSQRQVADALADAVDRLVRRRLASSPSDFHQLSHPPSTPATPGSAGCPLVARGNRGTPRGAAGTGSG